MAEAWRLAEGEPGGLRLGPLPGAAAAHFDPAARIVFTWNHVLGDPGWPQFSSGQLALGAETRAWLAANPDAARSAFESQVHWRGDSSLQLAPQRTLGTTTLTGFDGSVLLPPAVRVEVGSDTMIGELTRCIHPAAWNASLPFALPHMREARRQWLAPTETLAPSVNTALIAYARGCAGSIRAQDPAARLRALGDSFVDLSAASDAKLGTLIVEQRAASASWRAYAVNEQLHDATTPETWKQVLRQWLGSPLLRLDAATLRQQTLPLDALRSRAREFGRALIAWPRLWAWCRENPQ
jgi:hypothetical protein